MKRNIFRAVSCILGSTLLSVCVLTACGSPSNPSPNGSYNSSSADNSPTKYVIQYVDDNGVHTLQVASGELYSISEIPERYGYTFLGLFNAETGGTQYVNAQGYATSAFTDNQNLFLYPQFKPKNYTMILDYQGAAVTGGRFFAVQYGQSLVDLPVGLTLEAKTFTGWYTEPNCGGTQIADKYGLLPDKRLINEHNYDLENEQGYIYLYAGFKTKEYTVSFYHGNNPIPEEITVEHGTYISDIVTETRVNGMGAITWSKNKDGSPLFTGKITEDNLVFYAVDYAPVLEFESNGGNEIPDIIATAGTEITLPKPTREGYSFVGWQTQDGNICNSITMSSKSTTLTAVWNAILSFNENGGVSVQDISESAGTEITLPECTRSGYIFAGWYLGDELYTETAMPKNPITLKATFLPTLVKIAISLRQASSFE